MKRIISFVVLVRLFTILSISGMMAFTANAQTDSLLSFDDVEFTEITEAQLNGQEDNIIPSDYLGGAIPTTVILDKSGDIVARMEGGIIQIPK